MQEKNIGSVVQIIGPVLDIRFPAGHLPDLLNAIEIERDGGKLVCEVAQQLGDDVVRCIAMSSTDGMVRGMEAVDTGSPIKVPVGNETLGRVFNLLGRAIDNKPQPVTCEKWSIHRDPPAYDEQQNMIETDLHANKYDAMIIAPLQGDMASTLVSGTDMPIFAIDTDFNAPEKISFIGIGQKDAAASGGEKAVEAAKAAGWDKIEAAYIAGVQGDSTADARRTGFQEGIDGAGGTFLADEVQYADAVADKATVCMEGIMQSHPEGLAIIACHNDDCAIAAARAAANNPAYAKTIFIGFDGNITAAQSILDGGETMTVAQSGYDQGYQAVKTVVAHLNGEKVDSFVDCGTKVIDSTTAEDYMATLKSQMDGKAVAQ